MPTNFNCTKLSLSKCNSLWVVAIKQNANFKYQPTAMFVFSFFAKIVLLEVVHPLKIYQSAQFHGPASSSGTNFTSPQKFERPPFWNDCSYSIKITASR
jgi:hypothetical protein